MGRLQMHRNAKQEPGSTGEREKMLYRNAEREGKNKECGHGERKVPQERVHLCSAATRRLYVKALNWNKNCSILKQTAQLY